MYTVHYLGMGTLYSRTGVYVGEWAGGLQEGRGTALYNNGNKYSGEFKNGFKVKIFLSKAINIFFF